jgi:hypothetical protein
MCKGLLILQYSDVVQLYADSPSQLLESGEDDLETVP